MTLGVTIVASAASYPIDTVRRRMIMTSETGKKPFLILSLSRFLGVHYKSALDCAIQIIKNEGFNPFFKGNGANIHIRSVAGAFVLSGFDLLKACYIVLQEKEGFPVSSTDRS